MKGLVQDKSGIFQREQARPGNEADVAIQSKYLTLGLQLNTLLS
jgi:hypothetical protein